MRSRIHLLCGTAAALTLGLHGEGRAQTATASVSEVVVTAQRRAEILENVPMAVTVLTSETLEKSGVKNFMELGRVAPGLQMNYAGGVPGVALHGISTLVSAYALEANVGTYIDGFYQPQMITIAADLANIKSVEVLKGPQGTLYGRNATGGAILIETLGPSKTFTGKVDASYARFKDATINGYLAGPINDRLRFSVSAHGRRGDGWIKLIDPTTVGKTLGPAAPIREAAVRVKLEADVTSDLTALLAMNYSYSQNYGSNLITYVDHIAPSEPPPPSRPVGFGRGAAYNRNSRLYGYNYEPTLKLTYKTPIGTLTSYTGYAHRVVLNEFDFDGSYADLTYTRVKYGEETFQQTLDYQIDAISKLDLVVGASYYSDRAKTLPAIQSFGPNFALSSNVITNLRTDAWAFYADGTYHVTDRLSVAAGGRFTYEKKHAFAVITGRTGAIFVPPAQDEHTWKRFTPRVNVRYELAPRTNVYGSIAKGFRSGIYNSTGPVAGLPFTPVKPEDITSYEVGFKTANGLIRFQSSAFYYDYKNLQVSLVIPDPRCTPTPTVPCSVVSLLQNAPGAHIYGWDNEITVTPTQRLTLHAGVALLHARYKNFHNALGTGINAANTLNVPNQVQDWTGNRLSRAPDISGDASVEYVVPISYGELTVSANVNYTSRYAISTPSTYGPLAPAGQQTKERFTQNPYALLGAQATWTAPDQRYSITVYGTNLTNHVYRMGYNGGASGDYSTQAEPRSYGVRVGASF
jgi:iron complex outermembrane receptor protein